MIDLQTSGLIPDHLLKCTLSAQVYKIPIPIVQYVYCSRQTGAPVPPYCTGIFLLKKILKGRETEDPL